MKHLSISPSTLGLSEAVSSTIQANNSFCDTKHEKSFPHLTERKCVLHVRAALKQTLLGESRTENVKFCSDFSPNAVKLYSVGHVDSIRGRLQRTGYRESESDASRYEFIAVTKIK